MRRWAETIAIGSFLALAALPFVGLFPEPPAFGRGAAAVVAAVAVLAAVGTAYQAEQRQRTRGLDRAAILLAITIAAIGVQILLRDDITAKIPTADILPRVFGLQGEDIDDAVLYEVWVELWLGCAVLVVLLIGLLRVAGWRRTPPRPSPPRPSPPRPSPPRSSPVGGPWDRPPPPAVPTPRWNAATILLWLVGWAALGGGVLEGHWTAAFLFDATHVTGTIADPQPHPRIRFTTQTGLVVEFTQDGGVSRPLGAAVPVAYQADDPAGTARADTFWANWSVVLACLWIGLGFTLFPFFGFRAKLRGGRW